MSEPTLPPRDESASGPATSARLGAALRADQRQRWRAGERVPAEDYLARHPQLRGEPSVALDLIFNEFLLREQQGEQPTVEDFLRRFPEHARTLADQIDLHRAVAGSATALTQPPPAEGDTLGAGLGAPGLPCVPGYEVLGELGRGGMGVVFKARHLSLNRVVALKMILGGEQASPEQRIRFLQEAELLARLQHPNIVTVHEASTHQGYAYLALEFVDGPTLAEKYSAGPPAPHQAARLVETLAGAVQEAHRQGVIHRDLKPSNVLLAGGEVPKITDFGLARRAQVNAGLTQTGAVLGTPAYMAPEQAQGRTAGPAADVYGLGAILYELLTGRPPFCGATPLETLQRVLVEPPVPVRRLAPTVPRDLETIALKCLHKEPHRRYASAQALADDLHRFQLGESIAARPTGPVERAWRWGRRNPGWAAALSAVAGALLLLAAGSTLAAIWFADERRRALDAEQEANEQRETAEANLWQSYLSEARARRYSRRPGQRFEGLAALEKAARLRSDDRLRDLAISALALPDVRPARGLPDFPAGLPPVAFDRAYRLYAYPAKEGGILVRRVADHRVVHRLPGRAEEGVVTFSPGGRFLAMRGADDVLTVWRLADGRPVLRAPLAGRSSHTFGPDGRQLALGGAESVALFDLETGKERLRFPLPTPAHDLAWGDNGRLAVGHSAGPTARVYDAATGSLLMALPVGDVGSQLVAWHPDGERLAVAGVNDSPIQVWNVAVRHRVASLAGHVRTVASLTFHPGGGLLASNSWDGTVRLWEPATGREVLRLTAGRFHSAPRFSSDGRWLGCVAEGGKVRLLEVAPGRAYRTLVGRRGVWLGRYRRGDFSPDSRLLVVGTEDGAAVWDVATGRHVAELPAPTVSPFFLGAPAALFTAGPRGLHRWPLGPGRLGPPRRLAGFPLVSARLDRRALLGAAEKFLWVLDVGSGQARQVTIADDPTGSDQLALSPDGRLAAVASADTFEHHGWPTGGVKVWDVRTGKLVRELLGTQTWATFSPDGRLVTSGPDEYTFHDVPSWKVVRRIRRAAPDYPGQVAFSADGKLMALAIEAAVIRLEELATGRTVELEDPHGDRAGWIGFSPDGARLGVVAPDNKCVHVWDLRLLRRRLEEVGLDWTWPALRPAPPPSAPPRIVVDAGELDPTLAQRKVESEAPPAAFARREGEQPRQTIERASAALRVNPNDVEAYHYRGHAHERLGDFARAVADFTEALRRRPDDAHLLACRGGGRLRLRHYQDGIADLERALTLKIVPAEAAAACDRLAWLRVAGPADLRDARKARPLAERAVQLRAENAGYHRTLALVCYRLGQLDEARQAAQTSEARAARPSVQTAYVRAMILHRLGDTEARAVFRQAEARARQSWSSLSAGQKAALRALRNEAAVELAKPPPQP